MINSSGWSFINGIFVNITFLFSSLNPTVLIYRKIIESNDSYYSFIKGKMIVYSHLVHTDFFWMCETYFWPFDPFKILVRLWDLDYLCQPILMQWVLLLSGNTFYVSFINFNQLPLNSSSLMKTQVAQNSLLNIRNDT